MLSENGMRPGKTAAPEGAFLQRRYDVDWLRSMAMGLLIVFHVVLSFMPWAASMQYPHNEEYLEELIPFVSLITVWRIPILFMISGMGVRFAIERRDWKEMIKDRSIRIFLPWIFGIAILSPLIAVVLPRLGWTADYLINFGHLWFLLNIYLYTMCFLGLLLYLKDSPWNVFLRILAKLIRWPLGLFLLALPLMIEAWLVNPQYFSRYIDTLHGWLLGLICFLLGFLFISVQDAFWPAVTRIRWLTLLLAVSLYLVRLLVFHLSGEPKLLTALESMCWMLAIFGFGSRYLNKPSRGLGYCSRAVYPVYIVHLPLQFTIAYFLLPLQLSAYAKLALMLAGTLGGSLLIYEVVLRRLKWIRPLFGMKLNQR